MKKELRGLRSIELPLKGKISKMFESELKKFLSSFDPYMQNFFAKKLKDLGTYPHLIRDFYKSLADFMAGGKKMRGFLLYLGYRLGGSKDLKRILPICLAFEIVHNFLLIHDDIIDKSETRRGKVTIHKKYEKLFGAHYGTSQAIILGDIACFEAFRLVSFAKLDKLQKEITCDILSQVLLETAYGEALDVEYSFQNASLNQIWTVVDLKTARYTMVGPLTIGANLAKMGKKQVDSLVKYGLSVGQAFQLQDDILGVFGEEKITGKSTLSDIREGKNTLLINRAKQLANLNQKKLIDKLWGKENAQRNDLELICEIVKACGAYDWAQSEKLKLSRKAKTSVDLITDDEKLRKILFEIADFVVSRES